MSFSRRVVLAGLFAAVACTPAGPTPEELAVREAFESYRTAVLARDGQRASELIDRRTVELYQTYLELARTVDRAGLGGLDWMGKMVVLRLRHEFDAKQIAAMTGLTLFIAGVEHGWISDASVRSIEVAGVTVSGASASISVAQQPGVPLFQFTREADGWKLAMWKLMALTEPTMQKMFEDSGHKDPVGWVVDMIEAVSPRKFDRALLDGPPR